MSRQIYFFDEKGPRYVFFFGSQRSRRILFRKGGVTMGSYIKQTILSFGVTAFLFFFVGAACGDED